jgi:hypothetical protein
MSLSAGGFVAWLVLAVVTFRCCSAWRSEMWKYGLAPLGLLLWCAPDMAFGSTGAKAAGQVIATHGFWVAAVYLGGLLIAEFVSSETKKADS